METVTKEILVLAIHLPTPISLQASAQKTNSGKKKNLKIRKQSNKMPPEIILIKESMVQIEEMAS